MIRQGFSHLKANVPLLLKSENQGLSQLMRTEIELLFEDFKILEEKVKYYDKQIQHIYNNSEKCQRIGQLEGVGPMIATAIVALGDIAHMKNGRQFSAFLGIVPKQHSSGGKQKLLGTSKRGNPYIRKLLIHGAHAVLHRITNKTDSKSQWLRKMIERRGVNRTAVALANKNVRIIWKLLTSGDDYDPTLASGHAS